MGNTNTTDVHLPIRKQGRRTRRRKEEGGARSAGEGVWEARCEKWAWACRAGPQAPCPCGASRRTSAGPVPPRSPPAPASSSWPGPGGQQHTAGQDRVRQGKACGEQQARWRHQRMLRVQNLGGGDFGRPRGVVVNPPLLRGEQRRKRPAAAAAVPVLAPVQAAHADLVPGRAKPPFGGRRERGGVGFRHRMAAQQQHPPLPPLLGRVWQRLHVRRVRVQLVRQRHDDRVTEKHRRKKWEQASTRAGAP